MKYAYLIKCDKLDKRVGDMNHRNPKAQVTQMNLFGGELTMINFGLSIYLLFISLLSSKQLLLVLAWRLGLQLFECCACVLLKIARVGQADGGCTSLRSISLDRNMCYCVSTVKS
ncbi:unnamed protein product [Linum trigynum]|uniref:Uncharacterized protein n=1 Tax=Linum trigynum TaxID=586398 RepID=A0AAV2DRV6_9ROSI